MWIFLFISVSLAQTEVCPGPYDHDQWTADLDVAADAIGHGMLSDATGALKRAHRMTLCLEEPAQSAHLARMSRQLAWVFFFQQDEVATLRWGRAAVYADPAIPWPADVSEDHPLRAQLAEAGEAEIGGDGALAVPKKGAYFLAGKPLSEPRAPVEIPLFAQVFDKKGELVTQYWQDGAAFPEAFVVESGLPVEPPKWYVPVATSAKIRDPLFESAAAPAEAPPVEVEPSEVGDYVDPFVDARLRAIDRETSVREDVTASGMARTVTTEVVTFVEDTGPATAVLQRDFAAWLATRPDMKPATIEAAKTDKKYLSSWKNGAPPDEDAPVTWVSGIVARAYCDDWGSGLAAIDVMDPPASIGEWRDKSGDYAVRGPDSVDEARDPTTTDGNIGFRCNQ